MIRKATAKRSEANAAVRRRAAGLDQRFKMSASVAGFPSIYAATACLSFFVRSRRRALRSVLQLLQTPCSTPYTSIEGLKICWGPELILQALSASAVARLGCLH